MNASHYIERLHYKRARRLAYLLIVIASAALLVLFLAFPLNKPAPLLPTALVYPIMAPRVSSNYGWRIHPIRRFSARHHGIDLAAPLYTPIRSVASGVVVFADPYAGYGKLVVIQHDKRITSHYGHCKSIKVKPGQRVKAGEIVAEVGSTGVSTGPHLHFEIRADGVPKNPELFIPGLGREAKG